MCICICTDERDREKGVDVDLYAQVPVYLHLRTFVLGERLQYTEAGRDRGRDDHIVGTVQIDLRTYGIK